MIFTTFQFIKKNNFYKLSLLYLLIIFGIPSIVLLLIGLSTVNIKTSWYILSVILFFVSFYKGKYGLYILIFILPFLGTFQHGNQTHILILLNLSFLLGAYIKLLFINKFTKYRFCIKLQNKNYILILLSLWIIVSFYSLVGLPLLSFIQYVLEFGLHDTLNRLLLDSNIHYLTSIRAFMYNVIAIATATYILTLKNSMYIIKKILTLLIFGLFINISFGHLDYFELLNLDFLRDVNRPGGQFGSMSRIHSFFGNSTWFAQYLAITIPLIPVIFLLAKKYTSFNKMFILMVFLVVISEVTLILSMQRGAWITYPPTILVLWVSFYYIIAKRKNNTISLMDFFKKNIIKVLITIPLTISLSVFTVYAIKDYAKNQTIYNSSTINNAKTRLNLITDTSSRNFLWPPAIKITSMNPIYGGGVDSFGWQYIILYNEKNGILKNDQTKIKGHFHPIPHNAYLQISTGRGIVGVILIVSLLILISYYIIYSEIYIFKKTEESIVGITLLGSIIAISIYGLVQEFFHIHSLEIIFWIIIFSSLSLLQRTKFKGNRNQHSKFKYIFLISICLFIVHITTSYQFQTIIQY